MDGQVGHSWCDWRLESFGYLQNLQSKKMTCLPFLPNFLLSCFWKNLAIWPFGHLAFWLLGRWFRVELAQGYKPSMDGLRRFLAFGVFIHHAWIW